MDLSKYGKWLEIAGICLIIAIALCVRLEDLKDWKMRPNQSMYKGEPLLTTFDGYYYLSLAKDLIEGSYTPIDYNRDVPTGVKRRNPPPLLSVFGAYASKLTGWSLNWVGAVMPAFLGILLLIPLYGLARFYGGPPTAFVAGLASLLSFYYVYRSSVGWFDTDCMNVTWATGATFCFLLFAKDQSIKRYIYFVLGIAVYALFLLWWDSTPAVVTTICFIPFAISLVFFYRPASKRELTIFILALLAAMLMVLWWQGFDLPIRIAKQILGTYHYITTKSVVSNWPSIGATISEQAVPTVNELVQKTLYTKTAFLFGIIGLVILILRQPKNSLFLLVPIILAALSFFAAKRFLIFLGPILAIGLGYMVAMIFELKDLMKNSLVIQWPWTLPLFYLAATGVILTPLFITDMNKTFWPKEPPVIIEGFDQAKKLTPKDAILWAWWDHGYPILYFARRGVVGDGTIHGGERSSYNGLPFTTNNARLSANFMCFYAANGFKGIREFYSDLGKGDGKGQTLLYKILSGPPEDAKELLVKNGLSVEKWLKRLYPRNRRPVYMFVDWRLCLTNYWWFWLGSWNAEKRKGVHPYYRAILGLIQKDNELISKILNFKVDMDAGVAHFEGTEIPLRQLYVIGRNSYKKVFANRSKYEFDFLSIAGFGAIMDVYIAESIFNKLFLRHMYDKRYFRPVITKTPYYQIWEVNGDTI